MKLNLHELHVCCWFEFPKNDLIFELQLGHFKIIVGRSWVRQIGWLTPSGASKCLYGVPRAIKGYRGQGSFDGL